MVRYRPWFQWEACSRAITSTNPCKVAFLQHREPGVLSTKICHLQQLNGHENNCCMLALLWHSQVMVLEDYWKPNSN